MQSIIEREPAEGCYICGKGGHLERHHIFGKNACRRWSEKYGLTVHLCPECHRDNKKGVHSDADIMQALHKIGQAAFEKRRSRQEFVNVFGRNYLDDEETTEEKAESEGGEGFLFIDA